PQPQPHEEAPPEQSLLAAISHAGRGISRTSLTLAVIILVIVATLTLSLLLRRPSHVGDGYSARDAAARAVGWAVDTPTAAGSESVSGRNGTGHRHRPRDDQLGRRHRAREPGRDHPRRPGAPAAPQRRRVRAQRRRARRAPGAPAPPRRPAEHGVLA